MEGFKNSTRMKTFGDDAPSCYAKGGSVKGMAKVGKVMGEFGAGKLHSGSKKGPEVTNRKQAVAIALSEARAAGAKMPIKREGGGSSALTRAEREAMMEMPSHAMTRAEMRDANNMRMAKAAAPKREPLLPTRVPSSAEMQRVFGASRVKKSLLDKLSEPTGVYSSDAEERSAAYNKGKAFRELRGLEADPGIMTAAERRRINMDRPTSASGSSEYKKGGKVGGSKVPR